MYCRNCGNLLGENNKFCVRCGTRVDVFESAETNNVEVNVEEKAAVINSDAQTVIDNSSVQEVVDNNTAQPIVDSCDEQPVINNDAEIPVVERILEEAEADTYTELAVEDSNIDQPVVESAVVLQSIDNSVVQPVAQPVVENPYQSAYQQEQVSACVINDVPKKKDAKSTISLILGLLSTFLAFFINIIVFPVAIVGFILGLTSKTKGGKKTAGIILNVVAMVLAVLMLVGICLLVADNNTTHYIGHGYSLDYNSKWSVVTMDGGQEGFQYKSQDSYFVPIGKGALSDYECDFEYSTDQSELYDEFYDYWSEELSGKSLYLYEDNEFELLKDDIYYATYNYGKSKDDLRGKLYLVVSEDNNAVFSFMTNTSAGKVEKLDKQVLKLLDSISIFYFF